MRGVDWLLGRETPNPRPLKHGKGYRPDGEGSYGSSVPTGGSRPEVPAVEPLPPVPSGDLPLLALRMSDEAWRRVLDIIERPEEPE